MRKMKTVVEPCSHAATASDQTTLRADADSLPDLLQSTNQEMSQDLMQKFQSLVLDTIDKQGSIPDSSRLQMDEKSIDQLQLLGSLNSLSARDVSVSIGSAHMAVCSLYAN